MTAQQTPKRDVYDIVTDHIITFMDSGIIPWRVPWSIKGIPTNVVTNKPYRGINIPLLAMYSYDTNYFITESQLVNIGGSPKNDERPMLVTHWEWVDGKEDAKKLPLLKYHKIYNISQCNGIEQPAAYGEKKKKPIDVCKAIIKGMQNAPTVEYNKQSAFYEALTDVIHMPSGNEYRNGELYYYDFFRMLIHATGHESRLKRKEIIEMEPLTRDPFSREELIAEIGAFFLCYQAGIIQIPLLNSLPSIHGWATKFRDDSRLLVFAATQAQKAVDYILGTNTGYESEKDNTQRQPETDLNPSEEETV